MASSQFPFIQCPQPLAAVSATNSGLNQRTSKDSLFCLQFSVVLDFSIIRGVFKGPLSVNKMNGRPSKQGQDHSPCLPVMRWHVAGLLCLNDRSHY